MEKPKHNIQAFDSKKTWDRYTVIIDGAVFGMSPNANSPQGFNQYCGKENEFNKQNLGDEVEIMDLPLEVRLAIGDRLGAGRCKERVSLAF
jgi:hypothetical protein